MKRIDVIEQRRQRLQRTKKLALLRWEYDVRHCRRKEELRAEVALLTEEAAFVTDKLKIARDALMPWLKRDLRL